MASSAQWLHLRIFSENSWGWKLWWWRHRTKTARFLSVCLLVLVWWMNGWIIAMYYILPWLPYNLMDVIGQVFEMFQGQDIFTTPPSWNIFCSCRYNLKSHMFNPLTETTKTHGAVWTCPSESNWAFVWCLRTLETHLTLMHSTNST